MRLLVYVLLCMTFSSVVLAETVPQRDYNICEQEGHTDVFPLFGQKDVPVDASIVIRYFIDYRRECSQFFDEGILLRKQGSRDEIAGSLSSWDNKQRNYHTLVFKPSKPLEAQTTYLFTPPGRSREFRFTTGAAVTAPAGPMSFKLTSAEYQPLSANDTVGNCSVKLAVKYPNAHQLSTVFILSKPLANGQELSTQLLRTIAGSSLSREVTLNVRGHSDYSGSFCNRTEICLAAIFQDFDGKLRLNEQQSSCIKSQVLPALPEPEPFDEPPVNDGDVDVDGDGGTSPDVPKGGPDSPSSDPGKKPTPDKGINVRVGCGCHSADGGKPASMLWLSLVLLLGGIRQFDRKRKRP